MSCGCRNWDEDNVFDLWRWAEWLRLRSQCEEYACDLCAEGAGWCWGETFVGPYSYSLYICEPCA